MGWNRGLARSGAHALVLSLLLGGSGEAQAGTADASTPSLSLSLDPRLPQNGGFVLAPAPGELPVRAPPDGRAWTVWVSGYLRAPLRWSWGPATPVGDGYLGYAHLDARNADYLGGAVDVLHSAEGWQLHDNFFGVPGAIERATGRIDTVLFQNVISIGRLLRGESFTGGAPDLIAAAFAMWSRVSGAVDPAFDHAKLKAGGELTYLPLPWLGLGGRFDRVAPNLDDASQSFSVASPRILLRTAFMTHEQILLQYSRYFYGANAAHGPFPYGNQMFAANLGADRDAAQIAAIIWF